MPTSALSLATDCCPVCDQADRKLVINRFDGRQVVQCSECKHYYVSPPVPPERLDQLYSEYVDPGCTAEQLAAHFKEWVKWYEQEDSSYQAAIRYLSDSNLLNGKRVLDVGCGVGIFLNGCRSQGALVYGVEMNAQCCALAESTYGIKPYQGRIETAAERKIYAPESFDVVVSLEVIEHVERPADYLQWLRTMVRPDGVVLISTPNFGNVLDFGAQSPVILQHEEHLHYFDGDSLANLAKRCHLKVEKLISTAPWSPAAQIKSAQSRRTLPNLLWRIARRIPGVLPLKDFVLHRVDNSKLFNSRPAHLGLLAILRK